MLRFENISAEIDYKIPYSGSSDIIQHEFTRSAYVNIETTNAGVLTAIHLTDNPTGTTALNGTWYVHDFSPNCLREDDNQQYLNDEASAILRGLNWLGHEKVKRLTDQVLLVSANSLWEAHPDDAINLYYEKFLWTKLARAEIKLEEDRRNFSEFPIPERETSLNASLAKYHEVWKRCIADWHEGSKTFWDHRPRRFVKT